jgi:hypothetical protein
VVAVAYARGVAGREMLVPGWNVLGLLDLAVAITTGFLTSPSPLQMYSFDAPNELITAYPLVLVPVRLWPFDIDRGAAIRQQSRAKRTRQRQSRSVKMALAFKNSDQ